MIKADENNNKNIVALKTVQNNDANKINNILKVIANENDTEAMSYALKEKYHEVIFHNHRIRFPFWLQDNFHLIHFMLECGLNYNDSTFLSYIIPNYKNISELISILKISNLEEIEISLILVSMIRHYEVVKLLLTVPGINVNAKNNDSNTALIGASFHGHHEIVKLLLTVPGIDVNAKNWENKTALIGASITGNHEVVKLLLTVPGINVNAKDSCSDTALIHASEKGHNEIVKLLLAVPGIDINAKNWENKTALIYASIKGNHEVVKLLVAFPGIDVNAKDHNFRTAFDWASLNGHQKIIKLLKTVPGIDVNLNKVVKLLLADPGRNKH